MQRACAGHSGPRGPALRAHESIGGRRGGQSSWDRHIPPNGRGLRRAVTSMGDSAVTYRNGGQGLTPWVRCGLPRPPSAVAEHSVLADTGLEVDAGVRVLDRVLGHDLTLVDTFALEMAKEGDRFAALRDHVPLHDAVIRVVEDDRSGDVYQPIVQYLAGGVVVDLDALPPDIRDLIVPHEHVLDRVVRDGSTLEIPDDVLLDRQAREPGPVLLADLV